MDEIVKKVERLEDYCKSVGITDVPQFRREMAPFRCIIEIQGVEYYSASAYAEGLQEVFYQLRSDVTKKSTRKISDHAKHKRIVRMSPNWIKNSRGQITTAETKLKNAADPDERYDLQQDLKDLRDKLAKQEKRFATSSAELDRLNKEAEEASPVVQSD